MNEIIGTPKVIGAPAIISDGIKLSGFVQIFLRRVDCPDVNKLVFEDYNTIATHLKGKFRDTMNSNVDFALDNLRATQDATGTNGDDGISIYSTNAPSPSLIGIMASAVHPTDPSGDYYRQWQGVWQEPSASETVKSAQLGLNFTTSTSDFITEFADEDISPDIALVLNDVLTINWKIVVG